MSRHLLFYTIDERTDVAKYCKRKGLKPDKVEKKTLDNKLFEDIVQYSKDGSRYIVLDEKQCYSGYMLTLMKLPILSYEELLNVALSSKKYDERAGAIGIILKCYAPKFEEYLLETSNNLPDNLLERKKFKKMVHFINQMKQQNIQA